MLVISPKCTFKGRSRSVVSRSGAAFRPLRKRQFECRIPGNGFEMASILSSFGAQPRTGAAVKFIEIDGLNAGFKRIALSRLVSQLPSTSACYWTGYATSHFAAWSPLTGSVEIQKFNRGALGVVLVVLV